MDAPLDVESIRFKVDTMQYVEAGRDFREGTRLYDSAITGRVHLFINDDEFRVEKRIPDVFDVSDTVRAMHEMLNEVVQSGAATREPFCCNCGDRGCPYIRWQLDATDASVRLTVENLVGDPIGAHVYHLPLETLALAIADLAETLGDSMESAGWERTSAGTIDGFERRHAELQHWATTRN